MSRSTTVYYYFGAKGKLLYVGVTGRNMARAAEHARTKSWWPLAFTCRLEHYPTREQALARELYLIAKFQPEYNVIGKELSASDLRKGLRSRKQQYEPVVRRGGRPAKRQRSAA